MDAWDADFREPTEDERTARRVLSLAIAFVNAHRPLSTTELRREFYPHSMSDAAFAKTFSRDRKRLLTAGIVVRAAGKVDDISTWQIDSEASFAKEGELTATEALLLDFLLLPLASDPSFPYARDLRLALAKIDRAFDGSSHASIPPEARQRNNNISRLEDCMSAGHAANIVYVRADGTKTERTVAPYGFFFLLNNTYMVAANLNSPDDPPHTYRLDRVMSAKELARKSFVRPEDFDVRDFIMLPFQIGPAQYQAEFQKKDGSIMREDVCDQSMAVAWAIAEGVRPLSPQTLVDDWRQQLSNMEGANNGRS